MRPTRMIVAGLLSIALTGSVLAQPAPTAAELKADNDRLRRENESLETLARRLRTELDDARAAAVQAKIQADTFEMRVKKLQDELTLLKANRPTPVTTREDPKGELTSRTKPKPALIQGKITAIGKDGRMLQISVGSDAGVNVGQTLEVFRLPTITGQKPLYMGTISLTRVDPQASLGEFKPIGIEIRPKLGDDVANEIIVK